MSVIKDDDEEKTASPIYIQLREKTVHMDKSISIPTLELKCIRDCSYIYICTCIIEKEEPSKTKTDG